MSESLYTSARLYDLMYPQPSGPNTKTGFYLGLTAAAQPPVLEVACGTGSVLLPIAAQGIACEGIDLAEDMLAEARAKFEARQLNTPFHMGNMVNFDLGRRFGLIFIASNSLLHVHAAEGIIRCFQSVHRHLAHGGRFAFDIFNPSVQLLARADGTRREMLRFADPAQGEVRVDAEERYDTAVQVTRGTWYFSSEKDPDFRTVSIELRSIFPQELPLLIEAGGFRLLERYGDFAGSPFTNTSRQQVCVCEAV